MVWAYVRRRFWLLIAVSAAVSAVQSAFCLERSSVEFAGGFANSFTLVSEEASPNSVAKIKETVQSLKALIAKLSADRAKFDSLLHSASRPGQDVVKQYEQLGEQQKEFESQVKELCGLLAAMDSSEKEDRCVAGDTK